MPITEASLTSQSTSPDIAVFLVFKNTIRTLLIIKTGQLKDRYMLDFSL